MWSGLRPPPFTVTQPVLCVSPHSWIVIAATMLTIVFVFDPLGGKMAPYPPCIPEHLDSNNTNQLLTGLKTAAKSVWETRVQCCCCCVGQDDNTRVAFSSTADLFSTYFSVSGRDLLWSLSPVSVNGSVGRWVSTQSHVSHCQVASRTCTPWVRGWKHTAWVGLAGSS